MWRRYEDSTRERFNEPLARASDRAAEDDDSEHSSESSDDPSSPRADPRSWSAKDEQAVDEWSDRVLNLYYRVGLSLRDAHEEAGLDAEDRAKRVKARAQPHPWGRKYKPAKKPRVEQGTLDDWAVSVEADAWDNWLEWSEVSALLRGKAA